MTTTTFQIKQSETSTNPSLLFGEFGISSNSSGTIVNIGDNTSNLVPLNAFKIFGGGSDFEIPQFNYFVIANSNSQIINVTLPKTSKFSIGQIIMIKNIGTFSVNINASSGDSFDGNTTISLAPNNIFKLICLTENILTTF